MPECNRVTPFGEIIRSPLRGAWLGNRGSIHRDREIVRPWATRRWITCALEYKGWKAPMWIPGRWTPLFFYDEAVALAAGHRPCALCRREAYNAYQEACGIRGADAIDAVLHQQRLNGKQKRTHEIPWRDLPDGTFVLHQGRSCLVRARSVLTFNDFEGYGDALKRPSSGIAAALTPELSVQAMRNGYPVLMR